MTEPETPNEVATPRSPRPGQVWRSNDPRDKGRQVVVTEVGDLKSKVRNLETGKQSEIANTRLLAGGRSGFTFVETMSLIPEKITEFIGQYGFSPTVREIADMIGCPVPTAHRRLQALRVAGLVTWKDGAPRTLTAT